MQKSLEQRTIKKLRIAVIGGSFNPSTRAHMKLGKIILANKHADVINYVPCGFRKDKK